jgi:hypothetical protein
VPDFVRFDGLPLPARQDTIELCPHKLKFIMKKLLLICFVLSSVNCFSQDSFVGRLTKRLSFGLKAGANYSDYTHADFATDALVGWHAGGLVNFRITDNLSIQEEFLFSTQGAKVKNDLFGKENINVYYVTVPFLIKYRTNFGLYFEAGPQTGMRVNNDNTGSWGDFAKRLDLAAAGGLGFQTKGGFGIGARYIAGLSKVGDFNITNVKTDFRTNVIQASVFYIF